MNQIDLYKMALSMIPKMGPKSVRKLVSYLGGVESVFKEKPSAFKKVPGVNQSVLTTLNRDEILKKAEKELIHIDKQAYKWMFYLDSEYPFRLKECDDAPVVLHYKGENLFNTQKIVSIVGTRNSTEIGAQNCEKFVHDLVEMFPEVLIVSGFAYGVDICAHKAALKEGAKTLAVLGTNLDVVYPALHKKYVNQIQSQGGFVSEFYSGNKTDPGNFVSRNRIIAGLADATLVVESKNKGGALLTADMANSYNRDVFAFPGRVGDEFSAGCNNLIKHNKAALIESAQDFISYLQWDVDVKSKAVQQVLFQDLTSCEMAVVEVLKTFQTVELDQLSKKLKLPVSKVSATLLTLEFKGLVKALPGKTFQSI